MTEVAIVTCVGLLIAFVLVKGRATKALSDLRREVTSLVVEERRLRQDCEQASILEESAQAMYNQAEADCQKYKNELRELTASIERVDAELYKVRGDQDADA